MYVLHQDRQAPLYVQLYEQIRSDILSGKLRSHVKIPSVRELCVELSTSRNTVENAYHELLAEGYIYSKPRSGFFISAIDQELKPSAPVGRPSCAPIKETSRTVRYDFHPARLAPESFPAHIWRKLFIECLREVPMQLGNYRDTQGEWDLRCALRSYLERSRGVVCAPEQIVICSGLQQGLDIIAQLMKQKGGLRVGVEDPGYFLPRYVFRNHAIEVVPIPVGSSGLDLDALRRADCSSVYVTPSHQFPAGHVMPIAMRLQLVEWASAGDRIVIEDDYDSELRYHGKPIPSLQGLHPQGNIVYTGTVSKVLSPALRISYLVLPPALLEQYLSLFQGFFCTVSLLEQRTLAEFMKQGYWDRHLRRMRTIYRKRHDALLGAIERTFGRHADVIGQGAGLHLVLQLLDHPKSEDELLERAAEKGIRLFPFSKACASGRSDSKKFLLGFGGMTTEQLAKAVELLGEAWH